MGNTVNTTHKLQYPLLKFLWCQHNTCIGYNNKHAVLTWCFVNTGGMLKFNNSIVPFVWELGSLQIDSNQEGKGSMNVSTVQMFQPLSAVCNIWQVFFPKSHQLPLVGNARHWCVMLLSNAWQSRYSVGCLSNLLGNYSDYTPAVVTQQGYLLSQQGAQLDAEPFYWPAIQ